MWQKVVAKIWVSDFKSYKEISSVPEDLVTLVG